MGKRLIILSGPDRVGKSTLIKKMMNFWGKDHTEVYHHSKPSNDHEAILQQMYNSLDDFLNPNQPKSLGIFDRGWLCTYVYQLIRDNCFSIDYDIMRLEIALLEKGLRTYHVLLHRPWFWSAPFHLKELKELGYTNDKPRRLLLEQMETRRNEHNTYYEIASTFLMEKSCFPYFNLLSTESYNPENLYQQIINYEDGLSFSKE